MCCETIEEQLSAYFDGELSDDTSDVIRAHLEYCERCRTEINSFEQIRRHAWCISETNQKAPSWSELAARLDNAQSFVSPANAASPRSRRPVRFNDIFIIVVSLAATILIVVWARQPAVQLPQVARSHHSHDGTHAANSFAVNYQDMVALQRDDTRLAMSSLSKQYHGREASIEQARRELGHSPSVGLALASGTRLISTQLLKMPNCDCIEGECICGHGECNCVASVCERPDGSTFIVVEQCRGQNVNFGELPVQLVHRGNHELHVSQGEQGFAVTWKADRSRMTAFGLRDLDELDQLLAVN